MKFKPVANLAAVAALGVTLLTGCGAVTAQSLTSGTTAKQPVVLKVGAVPTPHAEILNDIKPVLAKEGINLQIVEFNDYIQPNRALASGQLDANYFQHVPYLDDYNKKNGTHLVPTVAVHFEPLGVYPGKSKSLKNIPNGATIAVPNDTTNEARALLLLETGGLIKLKQPETLQETKNDIVWNPHHIKVEEIDAAALPRVRRDVDFAVINGNYALQAGYTYKDTLLAEKAGSLAAKTYANCVVVRQGDQKKWAIEELDKAITSAQVKAFIISHYHGSVVPVFTVQAATNATPKKVVVLKVGASPVPHSEILNFIKPVLAKEGIQLQVVVFNDYIQPNRALSSGALDANYFQHIPYLTDYNQKNGTHLVPTVAVHFEPLGLYPGKSTSLKNVSDGATIAVPNDTTNEARALMLLESAGLIKLKQPETLEETKNDIVSNPHNIKIQEIDAAALPRVKRDVDFAVINGNYAVQAGYTYKDTLLAEKPNSLAAKTYANYVVVRPGDQKKWAIQALDKAITSAQVKQFIDSHYHGSVVAVFK